MQRVEIITGKERRRRWSVEEKRRLVAEAFEPGAVVAHVARRNDAAENCLYTWRKQLVGGLAGQRPALIPSCSRERRRRQCRVSSICLARATPSSHSPTVLASRFAPGSDKSSQRAYSLFKPEPPAQRCFSG